MSCWARGLVTRHKPGHVGDHGGEVGGAIELHGAQAVVVGLQDAIDAAARGVLLVAVLGAEDGEVKPRKEGGVGRWIANGL